jgi:hemerythrin
MKIGWQSTMETGAALLDAQHRAFVERADRLISLMEAGADRAAVEHAMREFGDYAVRHFETEGATATVAGQLSDNLCGWVSKYIPGPDAGSLPCVVAAQ